MKKKIRKAFMMMSLTATLLLVAVVSGKAQSNALRLTIPFDFTVGDRRLPAGEYIVGRIQPNSDENFLWIKFNG